MDALVHIPRETAASTVLLRCEVPADHPSARILGAERQGTAVAVEPHRVLTAHYLVMGASSVEVQAIDGRPRPVRKRRVDHDSGLATLDLEGPPLPPVPLGGGAPVAPGTPVFVLACTREGERKGATGHVIAVEPFEAFWEYMIDRALLTTAVNPGLAGAPLLGGSGRLLGTVALGLTAVGRYSLAVPVELYLGWRDGRASAPGDGPRAWVGLFTQGLEGAVVVTGVVPGSPAEEAGLGRGDVILSADGEQVASLRELYLAVRRRIPGETIGFQVLRDSSLRLVDVVAGDRDEFYR